VKWIAIIFLIGNVVLFGWQFNQHLKDQSVAARGLSPLPPKTPSLRLVSELPKLPPRRASAADDEAETGIDITIDSVDLTTELNSFGEPSNTCIDVGPFAEKRQLEDFRNWLRTRATAVYSRVETVSERQFFWIYLESVSGVQAEKSLNDLKARGVKDYMLVRRGGLKNAILLGLFRSQDSVNRRLAEMNRQGYKPVVVPKFESTENYYVRATMAVGSEDTTTVSDALAGDAEVAQIECSAMSAAAVIDAPYAKPDHLVKHPKISVNI
jgi:hypothetical protein